MSADFCAAVNRLKLRRARSGSHDAATALRQRESKASADESFVRDDFAMGFDENCATPKAFSVAPSSYCDRCERKDGSVNPISFPCAGVPFPECDARA